MPLRALLALAFLLILPSTAPASPAGDPSAAGATTEIDVEYSYEETTTPYPHAEGPGVTDIGNHCDDCTTLVNFPFPVTFYGQTYDSAYVGANGNVQFTGNSTSHDDGCLPNPNFGAAIFAYQDDLRTTGEFDEIRTHTYGSAPNRAFIIQWEVSFFVSSDRASFTVRLDENDPLIQVDYFGSANRFGSSAVAGVQASGTGPATQYSCQEPKLTFQRRVNYEPRNRLTVEKAGTGLGTVTSSPAGIDCGDVCTAKFDAGTAVTLTPEAEEYSTFTGWSGGGCTDTSSCVVTMEAAETVVANFELTRCPGFEEDKRPQLIGTTGGDTLVGGSGAEIICSLGGRDEVRGAGGNDLVIAGRGDDVVKGNGGKDRMNGGGGNDLLLGGPARDVAGGGPGEDACKAEVRRSC